jgi:hypothetical protein
MTKPVLWEPVTLFTLFFVSLNVSSFLPKINEKSAVKAVLTVKLVVQPTDFYL